jgi:hypothetical protein
VTHSSLEEDAIAAVSASRACAIDAELIASVPAALGKKSFVKCSCFELDRLCRSGGVAGRAVGAAEGNEASEG